MENEGFDMSSIDIKKPIIAKDAVSTYLLLPQIKEGSYTTIGYNWFNLKTMEYNSNCLFSTIKDAVNSYGYYNISNCDIEIN